MIIRKEIWLQRKRTKTRNAVRVAAALLANAEGLKAISERLEKIRSLS